MSFAVAAKRKLRRVNPEQRTAREKFFPGRYVEGDSGCEPRNRGSQEEGRMPMYICRWPNGDFSVVSAANRERAIELLDEIGNAEGAPISVIKDFMIHFELKDSGELKFVPVGWFAEGKIMKWDTRCLTTLGRKSQTGGLGRTSDRT